MNSVRRGQYVAVDETGHTFFRLGVALLSLDPIRYSIYLLACGLCLVRLPRYVIFCIRLGEVKLGWLHFIHIGLTCLNALSVVLGRHLTSWCREVCLHAQIPET